MSSQSTSCTTNVNTQLNTTTIEPIADADTEEEDVREEEDVECDNATDIAAKGNRNNNDKSVGGGELDNDLTITAASNSRSVSPLKQPTRSKSRKPVVVDKSRLTMFDLLSYNPPLSKEETEKRVKLEEKLQNESSKIVEAAAAREAEAAAEAEEEDDATENTGEVGPRVKVGVNGEIILDEESLVIKKKKTVEGPVVYESPIMSSLTTYSSFRRPRQTSNKPRWSEEETVRFYNALGLIGTDFTLMANLFFKDSRSRLDLRNKFKKEEKNRKALIDKALKGSDLSLLPDAEDINSLSASVCSDVDDKGGEGGAADDDDYEFKPAKSNTNVKDSADSNIADGISTRLRTKKRKFEEVERTAV